MSEFLETFTKSLWKDSFAKVWSPDYIDPVSGYLLKYRLNGSDGTLVSENGDDFREAPALPDTTGRWFNGTNQYINANSDVSILDGIQTGFTICAWVNSSLVSTQLLAEIGNYGLGGDGFRWSISPLGTIQLISNDDYNGTSDFVITDGDWHFVVSTYDGNQVDHFIDSQPDGISPVGVTFNTIDASSFVLGARENGTLFLNGGIDDLRIYNRVLTSNEITALYENIGIDL